MLRTALFSYRQVRVMVSSREWLCCDMGDTRWLFLWETGLLGNGGKGRDANISTEMGDK